MMAPIIMKIKAHTMRGIAIINTETTKRNINDGHPWNKHMVNDHYKIELKKCMGILTEHTFSINLWLMINHVDVHRKQTDGANTQRDTIRKFKMFQLSYG